MAEVEKLLTVGTEGNLRARAFLSCVYGGGLRLSEATHIQIKDLDGVRHRLLVAQHHRRLPPRARRTPGPDSKPAGIAGP